MKIRNNIALFGWGMSTVFLVFCGLFTYLVFRDGAGNIQINPPCNTNVYAPWFIQLILGTFWLTGIGVAFHLWHKPCVNVAVQPDGSVIITQRYPFSTERRTIHASMLHAAEVRESTDSEGDPYFECLLTLTDGSTFTIAEGSVRKQCDVACALINTAIGKCDVVARHARQKDG
jgi:hypothetical protein